MSAPRASKKLLALRGTIPKAILAKRTDDSVPVIGRNNRVEPPEGLHSEYIRKLWNITTANLIDLQVVAIQDLPQLEQAFIALEEFHDNRASIDAIREQHEGAVVDPAAISSITKLQRAMTNLSGTFTTIMSRYGISPSDRAKLTWGHLEQAQQRNVNPIERLLDS